MNEIELTSVDVGNKMVKSEPRLPVEVRVLNFFLYNLIN